MLRRFIKLIIPRFLTFEAQTKVEPDPMKFLIVGLGNIGAEYENTRHNIGFEVLDMLADQYKLIFKPNSHGDISEFKYKGRSIYLLKPSTYMNRSGKAVQYWMQKLKILPENLLIIVDDLHLDLGLIRIRSKGKDGGHNGLKSIDQHLGGNNYSRMRLGIGKDFHSGQQVHYVLGEWTEDEISTKKNMVERAKEAVLSFSFSGMDNTMNAFNS